MARTPLTKTLERIAEVREMMFSMAPESKVLSFFARKWQCKPHTVRNYMTEVRKEWAEEQKQFAAEDPNGDYRTSRRNMVRKALESQALRAYQRKVTRYNAAGAAIAQHIPDEKTFSRALRELIELDDLRINPEIRVTGSLSVNHDVGPTAMAELADHLRGKRRKSNEAATRAALEAEDDQASPE